MSLDIAAEPGLLTSFLRDIVLFPVCYQPMRSGMLHRILPIRLSLSARVELFQNLAACLLAVSAFGVVLRSLLMSVAVLHPPSMV